MINSLHLALLGTILTSWFLVGLVKVFKEPILASFAREGDLAAVQSAHSSVTPRLGGLGIICALAFAIVFFEETRTSQFSQVLLLSILPVFAAGISEDLGFQVSPKGRLLASGVSALIMIAFQQMWILSLGVPAMDLFFVVPAMAIPITLIWSAGLCHAFNLIDGLNGLAGSAAVIIATGLTVIAYFVGDDLIIYLSSLVIASVLGFLVHNWPKGSVFLGDGGAYCIGHILAWLGIALAVRNPEVAGISVALLFFWPVMDTLWAIHRRLNGGKKAGIPDRMHFHQLVMRSLEIRFGLRSKRHILNPFTSALLVPLIAVPVIVAVAAYKSPVVGFVAMITLAVTFVFLYYSVLRLTRRRKPRTFKPIEQATGSCQKDLS